MTNLFVAYNKKEDFRLAIVAGDSNEALELAKDYANNSCLLGNWEIEDFDIDDRFDCDYIITTIYQ